MRILIKVFVLVVFLFMPMLASAADLQAGLAAYDVGDYDTAMSECLPLAEAGNSDAQFCVGRMYANGFGVNMDDAEALKWYGLAAAGGHAEAQYNLGVMHANGWGVDMNDAEAARYYRMAAEQGFPLAAHSLAYVYSHGIGVEENLADAYTWYFVAAELGESSSISDREEIGDKLSDEARAASEQLAKTWLERIEHGVLYAGTED